jgi:cob(I)alamin adenosyltransferase
VNASQQSLMKRSIEFGVSTRKWNSAHEGRDALSLDTELENGLIEVSNFVGVGPHTSSLNLVMRALGHGMHVGIVEFVPGSVSMGEEKFLRRFPGEVTICSASPDLSLTEQDEDFNAERSEELAQIRAGKAWQQALEFLRNPTIGLVILGGLNRILSSEYLNVHQVVQHLLKRPLHQHVLITGFQAPAELLDIADTVFEIRTLKNSVAIGFD